MGLIPYSVIQEFENLNFYITDRVWLTPAEVVIDSLFYTLGRCNANKLESMQFLSNKINLLNSSDFGYLKSIVSHFEEYFKNPKKELFDTIGRSFLSRETLSDELPSSSAIFIVVPIVL